VDEPSTEPIAEFPPPQAAERHSEARLALLHNLAVGVALIAPDGRVQQANQALAGFLGYAPRELEGKHFGDLAHPDDLAIDAALRAELLGGGRYSYALDKRYVRKDGAIVWGHLSVSLFREAGDPAPYTLAVCEDITERKQAEAALAESDARFRLLADNATDLISRHTPEGIYLYASPASRPLLGYAPEELIGRSAYDFFHPDDLADIRLSHSTILLQPDTFTVAYRIRRKDGRYCWFETTSRTIRDPCSGAVQEIHAASRDITERRRAEEQRLALERRLLETQKLESLAALAGGVAHDFNNLLQGIIGYTELALADLAPADALRDSLGPILTLAWRAADLAGQMLAYSGRGHVAAQPLQLNTLVADMRPLLESLSNHVVAIALRLDPDLPPIMADAVQIRQALTSLVTNAAEALGYRAGTISVRTRLLDADRAYLASTIPAPELPAGRYAALEVADDGAGMDAATRARIFDPFFTTKFTGRGLGLAAVLGIVRGHGGTIHVEGEVGRGTTITLLFPTAPAAQRPPDAARPADVAPAAGRTVLIIDDEDTVRRVIARVLERAGFTVLTASDGPGGVECFRANEDRIDCVLLDLTMPGMSGGQVIPALRRVRPSARIVVMSGYTAEDVEAHLRGQSVAGFLHKPFHPADLRAAIGRALAEH
jgi:PAS domain S-box-containing protein